MESCVLTIIIFGLVSLPQVTSYYCNSVYTSELDLKIFEIINEQRAMRGSANHRNALILVSEGSHIAFGKLSNANYHGDSSRCPELYNYKWEKPIYCCPGFKGNIDCLNKVMQSIYNFPQPGMIIGAASSSHYELTVDNVETLLPPLLVMPAYNFILGNVDNSETEPPPFSYIGVATNGQRLAILSIPYTHRVYKVCSLGTTFPADIPLPTNPILSINSSYCDPSSTSLLLLQILNTINAERASRGSTNHQNALTLVSEGIDVAGLKISDANFNMSNNENSCPEFPNLYWTTPITCCPEPIACTDCAREVMCEIHDECIDGIRLGATSQAPALTIYNTFTHIPALLATPAFNFILGNVNYPTFGEPVAVHNIGIAVNTNGERVSIATMPSIDNDPLVFYSPCETHPAYQTFPPLDSLTIL